MNKGMKKLLEKYGDIIESVHREYNDGLDYWVYLKDGYICPEMECGTIHEYNLKDVERQLKSVIKEIDYDESVVINRMIDMLKN